MYKTIKITLLVVLLLSIASCTNTKTKSMFNFLKSYPKYDFNAEACAPKDFPCEVVSGGFFLANDAIIAIPEGSVLGTTGWGGFGAMHVVGPELKALPTAVSVTWVSYVEKKFYRGHFNLDYDLIANYFKKGYTDFEGNHTTFSTVKAGIAPGGYLVVWINGLGRQIEVGRFKAKEVEVTKEEFIPNAVLSVEEWLTKYRDKKLPPEYQNEDYYNNIPFNKWENYRKKYSWKPLLQFENEKKGELRVITINYFNGENMIRQGIDSNLLAYKKRALPIYIALNWKDSANNLFGAYIYFGATHTFESSEEFKPIEQEIFNAYDKIFNKNKAEKAELIFKIDKYNSHIQVFLKSEQDSIELKKMKINTFKRTK